MVIFVISGLAFITFLLPPQEKTQNYYLAKDMFSCSILFVAIPLTIVKKNMKMQNYFVHYLKNNQYYSRLIQVFGRFVIKRKPANNQVIPISFIDLTFTQTA